MSRKAPYLDYNGCEIFEGDYVVHPSGETGVVVYHHGHGAISDRWLVDYGEAGISRLCLQVGPLGAAVVQNVTSSQGKFVDGEPCEHPGCLHHVTLGGVDAWLVGDKSPKCLVCGSTMDSGHREEVLKRIKCAMNAEKRLVALVEAVAWEREFDEVLVWLVQTGRYPRDMGGKYDLAAERDCARAEVDRILEGADEAEG